VQLPTVSETVTVEAEAVQIQTAQASVSKAKDSSSKKFKNKGAARGDAASRSVRAAGSAGSSPMRWTVSSDGAVQRSLDSGQTWQTVPVAGNAVFRALAANNSDIWVGGAAGSLYHSTDAGQHWVKVTPVADGKPLTADIVSLDFADPQKGTLTTSSHETW